MWIGGFFCLSVLEEFLGEQGEVDAPVTPDVAAIVLVVFVGIALCVEVFTQFVVHPYQKIFLTNGNPEETWF